MTSARKGHLRCLLASAGLLLCTSCATLTADHDQVIAVTTTPPGAQCALTTADGEWSIATTPGEVKVPRAFAPLTITCTREGYAPETHMLEATTRGRAYGNILLLGLPAVVDASTGAGYEYSPASVALTLQPLATP